MIGCNHTSFEWTRAVRHIYGIIRHMQGLYYSTLDPLATSPPIDEIITDIKSRRQPDILLGAQTLKQWRS